MTSLDIVIKDYLEAPKTDYAIMINGEWGCGKSHYLHHEFLDLIRRVKVPEGDVVEAEKGSKKWRARASNDEETYSPAFISLYGVSSVEDFEYKVFCGINEWAENKLFRVASLFGSKLAGTKGINAGKGDLGAITFINRKRVLVFDDLERICEDRISIKEILGLINSYAEHSHLKVIIVNNEKEFPNIDEYTKYKEKSVRFTYEFIPDEGAVYDIMLEQISDAPYKDYLSKNKALILSVFRLGGNKNLRTLRFFIDTFGKIYNATEDTKYRDGVVRTLMVSFMLYVCENKSGAAEESLELLDMSKYKIDKSAFFGIQQDNGQDGTNGKDYLTAFREKYSEALSDFKPNHSMIRYVETGYIDIKELKKYAHEIDADIDRLVVKEEGRVYQNLTRMRDIEDADVAPLIDEMLKFVKEDRYTLYDLLNIYSLLLKYDYWAIDGFELTKELDDEFLAAIARQKVKHKYDPMFDVRTPVWDDSERGQRQYEKFKIMKDEAVGINWQAKNADDKSEGEFFLTIAERGDAGGIRCFRDKEETRISVSGFDWGRVMNIIINGSNPVACELCDCLIYFMPNSGFLSLNERDRVKKDFLPALNDYLAKKDNRIRNVYVRELRDHLVEVLH